MDVAWETNYSNSSDQILCNPCTIDGKQVRAKGYCQDCKDYLCYTCYNIHTKPLPSRHHFLIDSTEMPKTSPRDGGFGSDIVKCTATCPKHLNKTAETYCLDHNHPVCGTCAFSEHRTCKIEAIKKGFERFGKSVEDAQLESELGQLCQDIEECSVTIKENTKVEIQLCEQLENDICSVADELVTHIQREKARLLADVDQIKRAEMSHEQNLLSDFFVLTKRTKQMKENLVKTESTIGDLYTATKQARKDLHGLKGNLSEKSSKIEIDSYKFKPGIIFTDIISKRICLGEIIQSSCSKTALPNQIKCAAEKKGHLTQDYVQPKDWSIAKTVKLQSINVNLPTDKHYCYITGSVLLSQSTLLLADGNNRLLKMVDTSSGIVKSSLHLPAAPWDMTAVARDQAAVTLPDKKQVLFVSTESNLVLTRSFSVNGCCYGIDSTTEILVIAFVGRVEITDHNGAVLQIILSKKFQYFGYVTLGREGDTDMIYASDPTANSVNQWNLTGQLIFTYKDKDLCKPRGITGTEDGHVIVASGSNGQILLMSAHGTNIRKLVDGKDDNGLISPYTVCFCLETNRLYVSCCTLGKSLEYDDSIHVFEIQ